MEIELELDDEEDEDEEFVFEAVDPEAAAETIMHDDEALSWRRDELEVGDEEADRHFPLARTAPPVVTSPPAPPLLLLFCCMVDE